MGTRLSYSKIWCARRTRSLSGRAMSWMTHKIASCLLHRRYPTRFQPTVGIKRLSELSLSNTLQYIKIAFQYEKWSAHGSQDATVHARSLTCRTSEATRLKCYPNLHCWANNLTTTARLGFRVKRSFKSSYVLLKSPRQIRSPWAGEENIWVNVEREMLPSRTLSRR